MRGSNDSTIERCRGLDCHAIPNKNYGRIAKKLLTTKTSMPLVHHVIMPAKTGSQPPTSLILCSDSPPHPLAHFLPRTGNKQTKQDKTTMCC